jgi:uncharacterized protein (TIGR02996 family)
VKATTKAKARAKASPTAKKAAKKAAPAKKASAAAAAIAEGEVPELAAARAAIDAGDPGEALDALLDAWRRTRLPAIADAVDTVSRTIDDALPPIDDALRGAAYHAAWIAVAEEELSIDVGRLLPGLLREPLGELLIERVRRIVRRPEDPRIAAGLVAMVLEPPATSQSIIGKLWGPVFDALETLGDVRHRKALAKRAARADGKSLFWPQHLRKVERLVEKLPAVPVADAKLAKAVDAIVAASGKMAKAAKPGKARAAAKPAKPARPAKPAADDPLAMVHADPASEETRLVCADALLEQRDPRGELIQLQYAALRGEPSRAGAKRERELLKQHLERWIPKDLVPVLTPKQYALHLGFLGSCEVVIDTDARRDALLAHPAWSTVRELYTDDVALMTSPAMKSLVRVGSFDAPTLRALAAARRPLPIEAIGMLVLPALPPRDAAELAAVDARALPELRSLSCFASYELGAAGYADIPSHLWSSWAWIAAMPVARQLTTLELVAQLRDPSWRAAFDALPALERLILVDGMRRWELVREGATLALVLGIKDSRLDEAPQMRDFHERDVKAAIPHLVAMGVTSITVVDMLTNPLKEGLVDLARRLDSAQLPATYRAGGPPGLTSYEHRDIEVKRHQRLAKARRKRAGGR